MALQISIVTPSFNQAQFISQTLESVLSQDYPQLEYLVIDGGSTDGTVEILRQQTDPRLRWKSEPDNGQSDAINRGMQAAQGDILAYLNSDDVLLQGTLSFVADYFETHPDIDLLCGCVYTIDERGYRIPPELRVKPLTWWDILTMRMVLPQQGVFWRRRVMKQIGWFDESLHYRMDYDYWIRARLADLKFGTTWRFLAEYRVHDISKSIRQDELFWHDWYTILDKIYRRDDLPAEVVRLKTTAYSYASLYAGENYFRHGNLQAARPYLRTFLQGSGALRQKVYAAAMYLDSVFNTRFTRVIVPLYRRLKRIEEQD